MEKNFKPRLTLDTKKDYLLLNKIFNYFNAKTKIYIFL